jgi:hypothetical protein
MGNGKQKKRGFAGEGSSLCRVIANTPALSGIFNIETLMHHGE